MKTTSHLIAMLAVAAAGRSAAALPTLTLETVVTGLAPAVKLVHAGDGSDRRFVVLRDGRVQVVEPDGTLSPTTFLNVNTFESVLVGGERGLLGLAFHPDYGVPGAPSGDKFYAHYSAAATSGGNHDSVIAEFRVSSSDPTVYDTTYRRELMRFTQPFSNHNGGDLAFGPDDGFLYISTGDGGGSGDPGNNAQDRSNLLGNILRIDVNGTQGSLQYAIPASNPFVGEGGGVREEIFAYGLRNPFRFSIDDGPLGAASPDRIFVGDVGQNAWEEVNLVVSGGNYGWRFREGPDPFTGTPPPGTAFEEPIAFYANPAEGIAVIGGHVYRGSEFPNLQGLYIFGDLTGKIFVLEETLSGWDLTLDPVILGTPGGNQIHGFGTDEAGELYVLYFNTNNNQSTLVKIGSVADPEPVPPPAVIPEPGAAALVLLGLALACRPRRRERR